MGFSEEMWIQIIVYLVSLASIGGSLLQRVKNLEKKQDQFTGIVEKLYELEGEVKKLTENIKNNHYLIEDLKQNTTTEEIS